jgi:hypothetical protein
MNVKFPISEIRFILREQNTPSGNLTFVEASPWDNYGISQWESREYIFSHQGKTYLFMDFRTMTANVWAYASDQMEDMVECEEVFRVGKEWHLVRDEIEECFGMA